MQATETIYSKVAGTTYYNVPWQLINKQDMLEAVREPNNPYDANAIKLLHRGVQVGHLKKELAEQFAPLIDAGHAKLTILVTEVTGGDIQHNFFNPGTTVAKNQGLNILITITYSTAYMEEILEGVI